MLIFFASLALSLALLAFGLWFFPQPEHWTWSYGELWIYGNLAICVVVIILLITAVQWRRFNKDWKADEADEKWNGENDANSSDISTDLKAAIKQIRAYRQNQKRESYGSYLRDGINAFFLLIAAGIGLSQFGIFVKTNQTLESENRAWLAPRVATYDTFLTIHGPWSITVAYGNVGKEPALDFAAGEEFGSVPAPKLNEPWYAVFPRPILKIKCGLPPKDGDGSTIYPSGPIENRYTVSGGIKNFDVTQDILDGTRIMFIHGCFLYDSIARSHYSEYCFLLMPIGNHAILPEDRKGRPDGFRSISCVYGNRAT